MPRKAHESVWLWFYILKETNQNISHKQNEWTIQPDSELHIEKKKNLSQHLMVLSVYISLRFAKNTKKSSAFVKTYTR